MATYNPIAALLKLPLCDRWHLIEAAGTLWEYKSADPANFLCESLYRNNPGYGVGNPAFSLHRVPPDHHKMVLGQRLSGRRRGIKRAEAEAIVDGASAKIIRPLGVSVLV